MICNLIGNFFDNFVGIDIFGSLVKLIGIVKMLFMYIVIGLLMFLLILNVIVGEDGLMIKL